MDGSGGIQPLNVQPFVQGQMLCALLTINAKDLTAPWKFTGDFPTGKKLKDALDELTKQISALFIVHEEMGSKHKADTDRYAKFQEAMRVAEADASGKEEWVQALSDMRQTLEQDYVSRITQNDEERVKITEKLNAYHNVSSGIRKACGASMGECSVCLNDLVQVAYNCGHCICRKCDAQKRSHMCHLCGRLVSSRIDLFL